MVTARKLDNPQRLQLARLILTDSTPLTQIASNHSVSRTFLYKQKARAVQALDQAFAEPIDDKPLFWLPVTKRWLNQFVLCLLLHCHSSYRGVIKAMADLLDHRVSLGGISNLVGETIEQARQINSQENLTKVNVGAHDELFQYSKPILAGVDTHYLYCYLLEEAEQRDEDTWAIHWWDLEEKGFQPEVIMADFADGLRKGQQTASPGTPCLGDHFHAFKPMDDTLRFFRNKLKSSETLRLGLERKMEKAKKKKEGYKINAKLIQARKKEAHFRWIVEDLETLFGWLREDVMHPIGPDLETRKELFDFIIEEISRLEASQSHRIQELRKMLENNRDRLLEFAGRLDVIYGDLARDAKITKEVVMQLVKLQKYSQSKATYYSKAAPIRKLLKNRFYGLENRVKEILEGVVRTSSAVENYNSRLRNYFFLRKEIGHGYLELLRFYLNHTPFMRSRIPERKGKTPAELMTGKPQIHWLDQLGYERFQQVA